MSRAIAKPIFDSDDPVQVKSNPLPIALAAIDIVLDDDSSIEEIELNINDNICAVNSDVDFWKIVAKCKWTDRPGSNTWGAKQVMRDMTSASRSSFKEYCKKYENLLRTAVEEVSAFGILDRVLTSSEESALLSHVIGRGEVIYASISADPYFIGGFVAANKNNDTFVSFSKCVWG